MTVAGEVPTRQPGRLVSGSAGVHCGGWAERLGELPGERSGVVGSSGDAEVVGGDHGTGACGGVGAHGSVPDEGEEPEVDVALAGVAKVVEAVHDVRGEWLPSVPVITCTTSDPERVLAVLQSAATLQFIRHHVAGSGLSADTVRLSPRLLASIPLV
mgnify:CR=1 FL=1